MLPGSVGTSQSREERGAGEDRGQVLKGSGSQECQYIKQHLEKSSLNLSVLNYLGFHDIKL